MLKKETEVVIRGLLASDKSVAPEDIEKAIAYLQGRRDEDEDLTHVIRYKDVLKWLKIHSRTLDYYIQRGYLKRVGGFSQLIDFRPVVRAVRAICKCKLQIACTRVRFSLGD